MKDPIEEALERLKPTEMPAALMARLTAARPQPVEQQKVSFWKAWLIPLAGGVTALLLGLAWFHQDPATSKPSKPAVAAIPIQSNDYLVAARAMGTVVAPNNQPYRLVEFEWLEENTVKPSVEGPALRVETKRRNVVPMPVEIY